MGMPPSQTSPTAENGYKLQAKPVRAVLSAFLLCILIAAFWISGPAIGYSEPFSGAQSSTGQIFPEAPSIEGISDWINSEPMAITDLRGKVVMLDFWTYTCVNCIRTLPQLKDWHDQYCDNGLVIIGIHTPEFEFEKYKGNVAQAVEAHGISWPVALDNDYVTWDSYENVFWPTKYLIDAKGRLRYHRVGEGAYKRVEEEIRLLLIESGSNLSGDPPTNSPAHLPYPKYTEAPDREITRELYTGYERGDFEREYYGTGYVDQAEYYSEPGQNLLLQAPEYLAPGFLYFSGAWLNEIQRALHGRVSEDFEDYVSLVYSARTVNAVLAAVDGEPIKVRVQLDDEYLTDENRGPDVTIGADGESYLWVNRSRMYQVVANPRYAQRKELRLSVNSDQFAVYAFTFGIYDQGP